MKFSFLLFLIVLGESPLPLRTQHTHSTTVSKGVFAEPSKIHSLSSSSKDVVVHESIKPGGTTGGKSVGTINSSGTNKSVKKVVDEEDDDYDDYKDDEDELDEIDYIRSKGKAKQIHREWVEVPCPSKALEAHCHCGHQRDPNNHERTRAVVNCTHAGFQNADFFKHIPEDTEVLIVRGNKIKELPPNIFGIERRMDSLKELDLSDNLIEEMKGKTFHHVPNVDTLILNNNHIRGEVLVDHPRVFSNFYSLKYLHLTNAFEKDQWSLLNGLTQTFIQSNLTKLLKLHLEQNKISRIPNPREFCDLKMLMDLHLGQNEMTDIRIDIEDPECLPVLRFVDMSYNHVKSVSPTSGIYQLLTHYNQREEMVQVELYNNPFHCDCALDNFISWMKNISLKDPDRIRHRASMRCKTGYPESNKDKIIFKVNHTQCEPSLQTTNEVINRLSWTMFSLILISSAVILMAIYVHKVGLPSFLRGNCFHNLQGPLLSTTTGVKYTSVEKEEAAEVAHV